jgi:hypothetical protein
MPLSKTKRFRNRSRKKRWKSNSKGYSEIQVKFLLDKELNLAELSLALLSKLNSRKSSKTYRKKVEVVGNCLRMIQKTSHPWKRESQLHWQIMYLGHLSIRLDSLEEVRKELPQMTREKLRLRQLLRRPNRE